MMAKNTTHILKTSPKGGALPDLRDDLEKAVDYRQRLNSKAVEGKIKLKHAEPTILGGETVILEGVGPLFEGKYTIETHTLSLSRGSGLVSTLKVSRNAVGGEQTRDEETIDNLSPTVEGSVTTDEQVELEQLPGVAFEAFLEVSGGS